MWPAVAALPGRAISKAEHFLAERPFERAPWLAVAFGVGIALWFVLPGPSQWAALLSLCAAMIVGGLALAAGEGGAREPLPHLAAALAGIGLMVGAGCLTIGAKSTLSGTAPLASRGIY